MGCSKSEHANVTNSLQNCCVCVKRRIIYVCGIIEHSFKLSCPSTAYNKFVKKTLDRRILRQMCISTF